MNERVVVNLFSGAGGTSGAIDDAFRRARLPYTLTAINHDAMAVHAHTLNHPFANHMCRDLQDMNLREIAPDGRIHLLSASPSCTHHSKALGGAPVSEQLRSTPWVIPQILEFADVDSILIENVPEMLRWGPSRNGRRVSELNGVLFDQWVSTLRNYGMTVEWRVVDAADFGDPQHRVRLIVQAVKRGTIHWPRATHGPASRTKRPHVAASTIIDWHNPGRPVEETHVRSAHTWERIRVGLEKFNGEPFLLRRRQFDNPPESDCRDISKPLHTVTAGSTDIGLVIPTGKGRHGVNFRQLGVAELLRAMSYPPEFWVMGKKEKQVEMIGNGVPRKVAGAHFSALLHSTLASEARGARAA